MVCWSPTEGTHLRRGTTLPELILVLTIVGVLATIAVGRTTALRDRMSVRAAATETMATFALARRWAVSRTTRTAVALDSGSASLVVVAYTDTISHRRLGSSHG